MEKLKSDLDGYFPTQHDLAPDFCTKRAALHISPSVVSLVFSHSVDNLVYACSGTIVESKLSEGGVEYASSILTSVSFLTSTDGHGDPSNLKVVVNLWDDTEPCQGRLVGCDKYYGIAVVEITSATQLPVAVLAHMDADADSTELRKHNLIALGRHHQKPYDLMVSRGLLTYDYMFGEQAYEYIGFLRATCRISKVGIGGPLINTNGEVVGVNFYRDGFTSFLPVNIASKCLELIKHHSSKHCFRLVEVTPPYYWPGTEVSSLAGASMSLLEKLIQWYPNWRDGVLVEEDPLLMLLEYARSMLSSNVLENLSHVFQSSLTSFQRRLGKA